MIATEYQPHSDRDQHVAFVHRIWPADCRELAPIRIEVHRWLERLDLSGRARDDIVVAVNEATSNAVEHAYPPGTAAAPSRSSCGSRARRSASR